MDIRINLLPPEIKHQFEQRKKQQRLMIISAVILAIFVCVMIGLQIGTQKVRSDIAKLQQQKLGLEKQVTLLKPYQELQAKKEKVDKRVRQAMGTSADYTPLLEGIGIYMPPNVWLEEFSVSLEKKNDKNASQNNLMLNKDNEMLDKVNKVADDVVNKGFSNNGDQDKKKAEQLVSYGEVYIRGYALDHFSVANWLKELEKIPQITGIRCQFSSEEETAGELLTTFEIKAALVQPRDTQPSGQRVGE
ncbi:Fimbrial assembly family protein [Desulforamulus reducens MI-1]|uniref:Fimbrial assembly family protein n=1 Tax=Desulforamulus reducens (strain ATCC BAA-1160 / DSM 100696 / MI-1) TaxID=349161 RepID=A4J3C0_DESRM|nr:PilN domain-containing protein [Desulforamulus reducens]ABO49573.1 Fimbrial assembly family protein [Desulforamulus reducens MI-1]